MHLSSRKVVAVVAVTGLTGLTVAANLTLTTDNTWSFEGSTFIADGWEARGTGSVAGWSLERYDANAQFTGEYIAAPAAEAGSQLAMSTTGGQGNMKVSEVDNWLVSPILTVPEGKSFLSYLLAYNINYNSNSNLAPEERYSFEVLIEPTTDSIYYHDFVLLTADTLVNAIDQTPYPWELHTVDLSAWAGQQVRVAFHQHGKPNSVNTSASKFANDYTFIDQVCITAEEQCDLAIQAGPTLQKGALVEQEVTVPLVCNAGALDADVTMHYQVDLQEEVSETVHLTLTAGETTSFTFSQKATFLERQEAQGIRVWLECEADDYKGNNEASSSVKINTLGTMPYASSTETFPEDFVSETSNYKKGWAWYDNYQQWVYTYYKSKYYLNTVHRYALQADTLRFRLVANATKAGMQLDVCLTQDLQNRQLLVSVPIDGTVGVDNEYIFEAVVPEAGDYILSLIGSGSDGQIAMTSLEFGGEQYEPADDPWDIDDSTRGASYVLPYATSFESGQDSLDWLRRNPDRDLDYWGIEETYPYVMEGRRSMFLNWERYLHNDWVISPKLSCYKPEPDGEAPDDEPSVVPQSLRFYYGSTNDFSTTGKYPQEHLRAYLVPASRIKVDEILAQGTLLGEVNVRNYFQLANFNFEAPAVGSFRIALLACDGYDNVFLDQLSVSQSPELLLTGAEITRVGDDTLRITTQLVNCSPLSIADDVQLQFTLNRTDSLGNVTTTHSQAETLSLNLPAATGCGDTLSYTFTQYVLHPQLGTYTALVELTPAEGIDTDLTNNQWTSAPCVVEISPDHEIEEGSVELCEDNFPDDIFMSRLARFDYDHDGWLSPSEIAQIKTLNYDAYDSSTGEVDPMRALWSIEGIQYLTSLTSVVLNYNAIEEADFSQNPALTSIAMGVNDLKHIDVSGCPQLTSLSIMMNDLSELDVTHCPLLENLSIGINQIAQLDLSQCPALTKLNAPYNRLYALDLSANTKLQSLSLYGNQLCCLDLDGLEQEIPDNAFWCDNDGQGNYNVHEVILDQESRLLLDSLQASTGFDISRVSNLKGATLSDDGAYLLFKDEIISYTYRVSPAKQVTFKIRGELTISIETIGKDAASANTLHCYDLMGREVKPSDKAIRLNKDNHTYIIINN